MNQFPPSSRVFHLDRFEYSRRYSRVKVHHRYQRHRWQIFLSFSLALLIPAANLPPVSTIPANRQTLSYEYLREFSKKFETALMVQSEAWGKLVQEKNQKQKISWHCPFKHLTILFLFPSKTFLPLLETTPQKQKEQRQKQIDVSFSWCLFPSCTFKFFAIFSYFLHLSSLSAC